MYLFSDSHFHSLCSRSVDYYNVFKKLRFGIDVCSSIKDLDGILANIKNASNIYAAAGSGPWCAKSIEGNDAMVDSLEIVLNGCDRIAVVGEIGLDYHDERNAESSIQRDLFVKQLDLACQKGFPVMLHVRDSFRDVYDIVSSYKFPCRNIFHCFTGDRSIALKYADLGFYIAFGGSLTYRGNDAQRDAFQSLPSDCILFETDSPYLSPVPLRGTENSPLNVPLIISFASKLRALSVEELSETANNNFDNFLSQRRI